MPYWDFTRSYPADRNGEPLRLLCQINFNDLAICAHPQLTQQGLLQIFLPQDATSEIEKPKAQAVYYPDLPDASSLNPDAVRDKFERSGLDLVKIGLELPDRIWEENKWPLSNEVALTFKPVISLPKMGDFLNYKSALNSALTVMLSIPETDNASGEDEGLELFDRIDEDSRDILREMTAEPVGLTAKELQTPVGEMMGYPNFIERNPMGRQKIRRYDCDLLMLNSVYHKDWFELMWDNDGIAHFFINSNRLSQRHFKDIYYIWDSWW